MAWGAAATGTPAATGSTGQGLSLMQESLSEIDARRAPARRVQHGAGAGRLLPGDARRRPRRLPPHRARAHGRPRGGRAHPARVPPRRQVAQPGARLRRLLPRAHARSRSTSSRVDFAPLPAEDWALDGSTERHRRRPAACRRSASASTATTAATTSTQHYAACAPGDRGDARRHRAAAPRPGSSTTPRSSSSRSARPAKFVRSAVAQLRAEGAQVGYVRPITLWPFPTDAIAAARRRRARGRVFENSRAR